MQRNSQQAFSLVELSIVLVILGLLTGGILSGQSLIRASELRSVTTQAAQYHTSVMTFLDQYNALPGDMKDATRYWGTDPDGCPSHSNWETAKAATCDGDGSSSYSNRPELFRAWQHLANAGLIEGSYSGVSGPGTCSGVSGNHHILGANSPNLRMARVGMSIGTITPMAPGYIDYMFAGSYGNQFNIGAETGGCNPIGAVFVPQDAWNIDTKLDDGKPGMGKLMTRTSCTGGGCMPNCNTATTSAGANTAATAEYLLGGTATACAFYYLF